MLRMALAMLLILASTFDISIGGMLPNGNFEHEPRPTQMSGTKVESKNAIPNWETMGHVEYIKTGTKENDMVLVVPEGKHAVRLGVEAAIKQTIKVEKGKYYALTFSFGRTCSQDEKLNVTILPNFERSHHGILPLQTMYNSIGFDSYAWGFIAQAHVVDIVLHNPGVPGELDHSCGPLIDTVALNILNPLKFTRANLVKNGDFKEGPYIFHQSTWGVLIPPSMEDDHSPLPGWIIDSLKAVKYIDSTHFYVPKGKKAVELVGGKEGSISQIIRTIPDKYYLLTFLVGDANNGCAGPLAVEAFAAKSSKTVHYMSKGKGGFIQDKLIFKAEKTRTNIRFLSTYYTMTVDGSMCGPVIDDVKVVTTRYITPRHV